MNDAELIAQFRAGQIAAFNTLVKRWECPIYNFVLRYVGNRDDARDLCQQTFIRAYKSMRRLRDPRQIHLVDLSNRAQRLPRRWSPSQPRLPRHTRHPYCRHIISPRRADTRTKRSGPAQPRTAKSARRTARGHHHERISGTKIHRNSPNT